MYNNSPPSKNADAGESLNWETYKLYSFYFKESDFRLKSA